MRHRFAAAGAAPRSRLMGLLLLAGEVLAAGCGRGHAPGDRARVTSRPAPVTVATVLAAPAPVTLRAIGSVETYATVAVKSQVAGEVQGVHFAEGQHVRIGDLLFTIDPAPLAAALRQAEANLSRDTVQMKNAQREAARLASLVKEEASSQDDYDQAKAAADALAATVRGDEAVVDLARITLSYCVIKSPIDGHTGSVLIHPGNLVKANDLPLVVINRMQPIYVTFALV